ncbi:MAG: ATP-binding protein [Bradymonadaceae bacterium]|nr:ATP-binding protein [Lujinxingiaceae bacterium]
MPESPLLKKPEAILDRQREWNQLARSWRRERPELIFVVGRRRIGKSFVLSRFAKQAGGLYYQATRRTESEQLASLSQIFGQHFDDAALIQGALLPSWEALFEYLTQKVGSSPFVLVLDEFPYLTAVSGALTSIIQRFWDHQWQGSRIRLVLSGSYVSAMKQLEEHDQPLYGRRTARISFAPFSCAAAAGFAPQWSARQQFLLYGIVGNLPGHLALIDPSLSLGENIGEMMLDPGGRLVDEAERLLDAFVPDAEVHYSIIEAIATGDRAWGRLTSRVGKSGGSLLRPLQWLEQMQLIERRVPITENKPERSRRALYHIIDPYLTFWHSTVAPLVRAGSIGLVDPQTLWSQMIEPALDDHMGAVFEQICREHVATLEFPFRPVRVGSWWDHKSQNEVDIVAISAHDQLFVAECKWGGVSGRDLDLLRHRSRLVAAELPHVSSIHLGLFSGRGQADDFVQAAVQAGEVLLFGPEDLLR